MFRLNFPNQDEAQNFSKYMKRALDDVLGRVSFEETDVYRPQASVASLHSTTSNHMTNHVTNRSSQPEPTHFTPTIAASSSSNNRNGLGFDRIQIADRNYARKRSKHIYKFIHRLNFQRINMMKNDTNMNVNAKISKSNLKHLRGKRVGGEVPGVSRL